MRSRRWSASSIGSRLAAVTLVVALAACGGEGDADVGATVAAAAQGSVADDGVATGGTAENAAFLVPTADGGQLDFNSLQGKDVMLWFWAPW